MFRFGHAEHVCVWHNFTMKQLPAESKPVADNEADLAGNNDSGESSQVVAVDHAVCSAEKQQPKEIGGRDGPDPTRFGDWEKAGRCVDF
jgi:hypothetical protein